MAKDLKFNIEKINDMKTYIDNAAVDIADTKKKAVEALEKLQENWNTPAGKKFTENVDFSWTDEVDKYIKVVETVSSLLEEAATDYQEVEDAVNALNFDLTEV